MTVKKLFVSKDVKEYRVLINELEEFGYRSLFNNAVLDNLESNSINNIIFQLNSKNLSYYLKNRAKIKIPVIFLGSISELDSSGREIINKIGSIKIINDTYSMDHLATVLDKIFKRSYSISENPDTGFWFNGILNASSEGIIAIDKSSRIKYINPIAQNLVGIEYFNSIGKEASSILKFKEPEKVDVFCSKINSLTTDSFEGELFNRITKAYNAVSGKITTVRDNSGSIKGRLLTIKDVGEIKTLFNRVKYQSSHDNLTGLMNRQSFINSADELIALSKCDDSSHGLLVIALDKFKIINDTSGHIAGDELLRKISYILRDIDPKNNFIKARIGGDEFAILFKNRSLSEIKHFTKSIKRKLSNQEFIWGDKEFPINSSFGIVVIDSNTENHHTLLAAADDACSIAKEKGGNKIEIYNDIKDEYHTRRGEILWIHKLKEVINSKQVLLYYQIIEPVVKEDFKKIEILVRLKDENGQIINPGDFIPPAERYGVMPEIDKIVIEKSIESCKKIIETRSGDNKYLFSINISGTSIPDKSLPGFILSLFQKYKVPPTLFCFEITETATIKNLELAKNFINNLKRIGCRFSLDDFGSGFSNFTYLRELKVDYLKIDGSFIKDILDEPINRAMVESINQIGHIMKMKTIAEYVSDESIKSELVKIGVDYLQGYAICKPTPLDILLN